MWVSCTWEGVGLFFTYSILSFKWLTVYCGILNHLSTGKLPPTFPNMINWCSPIWRSWWKFDLWETLQGIFILQYGNTIRDKCLYQNVSYLGTIKWTRSLHNNANITPDPSSCCIKPLANHIEDSIHSLLSLVIHPKVNIKSLCLFYNYIII